MLLPCLAACGENDSEAPETTDKIETPGSDEVDASDENIIRPPVRESKYQASASFIFLSLKEIEEEADAIVRLKIKNWLGESIYYGRTYYDAEVIEVYKGDVPSSIILAQFGTSEETFRGFPLFTYGEEVILFLGKYESQDNKYGEMSLNIEEPEFDANRVYGIHYMHLYVMNVSSIDDGSEYVIPTTSIALERNDSLVNSIMNYGSGSESGITSEAVSAASALMKIDPYDNPGASPECVYALNDFVEYLKVIQNEER